VKILKAELPWRLIGMAWLPEDEALAARERLRGRMPAFPYAACVPFGRDRSGVLFRAAAYEAPPAAAIAAIEQVLGLAGSDVLHYADKRRGQHRSMRLRRDGADTRLDGFLLAGDVSAEAWIRTLLQDGLPAQAYGRSLLAAGAKPPAAPPSRGRQVCSCFDVGESDIARRLADCAGTADAQLQQLKSALKCGTNCGSCIPELQRLVRQRLQAA